MPKRLTLATAVLAAALAAPAHAGIGPQITNFTLSVTPALITRQRRNLGRTRSSGIEAEADYRPSSHWRLSAGYLFADATVRRAQIGRAHV